MNLVINARDAITGHGKIQVETANVDLDEQYVRSHHGAKAGPHVMIAVSDNGAGIPAEHHARVWQLFQTLQSHDALDTTGIGLAIVRKQVESNGGRVWIDPAASSGTTIRLTWPKRTK
jgi:signal transduction histidine kinase